jgi:hypothetical protein
MSSRFAISLLALLFVASEAVAAGKGGSGGTVTVRGHIRKDGTYVPPHQRTAPDGSFQNNWSTVGNYNPYTGEEGKVVTPPTRATGAGGGALPLYYPVSPQGFAPTIPATPAQPRTPSPKPQAAGSFLLDPSRLTEPDPLATPSLPAAALPSLPPAEQSRAQPASRPLTYLEAQKQRDIERAQFWQARGHAFNPTYMTAYSMDQKVKDIERARFWKEKGYTFSPEYMTAYSMDQKVKDIDRAQYWRSKGYSFNPDYMTAYSMDQKVRDIERAQFWSARGLNFDPNYMTAYSMDREAERLEQKAR